MRSSLKESGTCDETAYCNIRKLRKLTSQKRKEHNHDTKPKMNTYIQWRRYTRVRQIK